MILVKTVKPICILYSCMQDSSRKGFRLQQLCSLRFSCHTASVHVRTCVRASVCTSAWALESTPALEWKSPLSAIYMQIKTHPLSSTEMHSGIVSFLWPVQVKQKLLLLLLLFVTLKHIKLPLFLSPPSKTQRVFTLRSTLWGENGQFSYLTSIAIFI